MILAGMFGASQLEAQVRRLFAGGVPGIQLDLVHKANLYQDSARTTLVSANGDAIGSPTDLSGNNKHPVQATATSRALYQGYAAFDGIDDSWVTPTIDFTGTDAVTIVAALRKNSDAAAGIVCELGPVWSFAGCFGLAAPQSASSTVGVGGRGTNFVNASAGGYVAPVSMLATGTLRVSTDTCTIRVDGVLKGSSAADQGAGNFRSDVINIGRRNNFNVPFNGGLAGLTVIGRVLSASEFALLERYGNFLKTGLPA